jgi:hypothetical protein
VVVRLRLADRALPLLSATTNESQDAHASSAFL